MSFYCIQRQKPWTISVRLDFVVSNANLYIDEKIWKKNSIEICVLKKMKILTRLRKSRHIEIVWGFQTQMFKFQSTNNLFVFVEMQLQHNKCYFLVTTLKDNVTVAAFEKFKSRPKVLSSPYDKKNYMPLWRKTDIEMERN